MAIFAPLGIDIGSPGNFCTYGFIVFLLSIKKHEIRDCPFITLMPCPSAWKKYFLSGQKILSYAKKVHTYLLVKWMKNEFLAMDKVFHG